MNRIEIDFPSSPMIGFGATVGLLSFLVSTGKSYRIYTDPAYSKTKTIEEFAELFGISEDVIEFVPVSNRPISRDFVDSLMDNAKVYSRYITTNNLNMFGKQFPLKTGLKKPYICLAIAGTTIAARNIYFDDTAELIAKDCFPPKFRDYTRKEVNKIIELIIAAGYDIVTLESPDITMQHKAFVLNELCDCVIGYEGGMMHLAHSLNIPTIIFPWAQGHDVLENWVIPDCRVTRSMLMHLDKKTYFLENAEELHSWDSVKFTQIIDQLKNDLGNNTLLSSEIFEKLKQMDIDQRLFAVAVPELLRDSVKQMPTLNLGGYMTGIQGQKND